MKPKKLLILLVAVMILATQTSLDAQDDAYPMIGVRNGNQWVVPLQDEGKTRIPRVFASLRAAYFDGHPDVKVNVHPEIKYWELRIKGDRPSSNVVLEFDSPPLLIDETEPARQLGDGSIVLACHQGRTTGEKLRFEPQAHKNTIGYWAVANDYVTWPIQIEQAGTFNVGLLQGAGARGGGVARVSLLDRNEEVVDSFECEVEVTGHFQNFVWKHGGELEVKKAGRYGLRIEAAKINDVALMDVRQVQMTRQPNK